ncbi:MAG TPA: hypothetical protein ACFYDZ_10015 [Candidatus Brocadiaceae bacterium]
MMDKSIQLNTIMIILISGIFTVSFPWFVKPAVRESTKKDNHLHESAVDRKEIK